jgi:phospholipid/cholesterol/gamma-HCH transport system ATP-binding protein
MAFGGKTAGSSEWTVSPKPGEEVIRLEKVYKRFGSTRVFDGIDLSFRYGETTVVLGRSGCGKSVLLKMIIGILKPDSGRVIVFGRNLAELNQRDMETLRLNFGMLFQGAALFDSMNVNANVGFLLYEHTALSDAEIQQTVRQKLAMVNLEGVENMMPADLSGGMKKRVALARAIAMDPKIILYDEPTTGLDPVTADSINQLMIKLQKELKNTSIVVTHDMASTMKIAHRIVMLHEGQVILDATPPEVQQSRDPRVQSFIHGDATLEAGATVQSGGKS